MIGEFNINNVSLKIFVVSIFLLIYDFDPHF